MRNIGDTGKWEQVQAFDPSTGDALPALLAADFPPLLIYNETTLVAIAALTNAANMSAWGEGKIFNAGGGRYFVGMPNASYALAGYTHVWGRSGSVEVSSPPIDVQASSGLGDGNIAVNHDTGGTDALRFVHSGQGVANAVIRAYLKSEYDTGIRTVRGESRTGDDGRWVADMMLNALTYTITFDAEGYKLKTAEVTVVA